MTDIVSCQAICTRRRFSPDCLLARMRQNWSFNSGAHIALKNKEKTGAPDTIRTCDLCLRRVALYPAELRAQCLAVQRPNESNPLGFCCDIVKPVFPALSYDHGSRAMCMASHFGHDRSAHNDNIQRSHRAPKPMKFGRFKPGQGQVLSRQIAVDTANRIPSKAAIIRTNSSCVGHRRHHGRRRAANAEGRNSAVSVFERLQSTWASRVLASTIIFRRRRTSRQPSSSAIPHRRRI